ncbi:SirB1 family protein [Rhabdothermincola sp.]|uniref:SirB1 family protein n=1 Tax=Rhabdothermincola sp. TaxID=2820405 RepID=UPI002FE12D09
MQVTEQFADLLDGPEDAVPLDRAALLIAAHAYPGLDVEAELATIDCIAEGCFAPTLDALVRYLFVDLAFRGNRTAYHDPRNSYLNEVIRRRRGIPITLSVLAMAVGRRLAVPLAGVGMPGHFLLRDRVDPSVFVDPFAAGAFLDRAGCERVFRAVHGQDAVFDEAYLAPVGPFAILARMLANLRVVFATAVDHTGLAWVLRLRSLVPGVPIEERAELAAVLAASGDFRGAARELDIVAERVGGGTGEEYARRAARLRARLN